MEPGEEPQAGGSFFWGICFETWDSIGRRWGKGRESGFWGVLGSPGVLGVKRECSY